MHMFQLHEVCITLINLYPVVCCLLWWVAIRLTAPYEIAS